jgi:HlyD family secretion protein
VVIGLAAVTASVLGARTLFPPVVSGVSLERRDIVRTLVLVGRVRPRSLARLGASAAGTITEVRVREGDPVSAGEVLVTLDDREARAAVAEAEAALAETTASVKSTIEQAEQEAAAAAREVARLRAVASEGGLTRERVEQAQQRAADAASRLEAARAQAGPDGRGSGIASVIRATAALEAARARLSRLQVRAPAAGRVLARDVEPGDVTQGGQTLLEVALAGPTELVVFPAEENLAGLELGAMAMASADAYPDLTFPTTVTYIAPAIDPAQGTVEVRLTVESPPDHLLPDMTLSVNIEAGRRPDASVLPADAVRGLGTPEPWVALVDGGRLTRRGVEVGLRTDGWVEIRSGLSPDEWVVPVQGSPDLGDRVRLRTAREN